MAIAPEPYLSACLEVLYRASIHARAIGWTAEREGLPSKAGEDLAALMEAVHNLPHLIQRWESCDVALLERMLQEYESEWKRAGLWHAYQSKMGRLRVEPS